MRTAGLTILRHYLLAAVVLLPMLVMSVFPQGTMAARGVQGLEVVLCTGDGPFTIIVDENGAPIEEQHVDAADCGWWLLGQGLIFNSSPGTNAPRTACLKKTSCVETAQTHLSRVPSYHPARAPPSV